MGGFAWVTLATNDSYSLGAIVLGHSLKITNTAHQLVVLITPGVSDAMKQKLSAVFNIVQEVNVLDSKDEVNLTLLKRPELGVTFTKLHCWRLTQFEKCVFLDADTMVLQNCDELFEKEELSGAPDVGWPDCFNSGVFVYRPSNETYESLIKFAVEKGSFDGGDQGLLNAYFSDWAYKDISKHLPFIYNMACTTALYSYLPAFKQFGLNAKIIHFISGSKPWLQYFNTETKKVYTPSNMQHLNNFLQKWWDIFCSLVHPVLSSDMPMQDFCDKLKARSTSDVLHANPSIISTNSNPFIIESNNTLNDLKNIWDPWEEYESKPNNPIQTFIENEPLETKPIESHNTNAFSNYIEQYINLSNYPEESNNKNDNSSNCSNNNTNDNISNHSDENKDIPIYPEENNNFYVNSNKCDPINLETIPKPPSPVLPSECQTKESTINISSNEDTSDGGIAGAFAQLTLGAPRTAEQNALDDHLRRQGWEVGNIDYLGKDSFDNIWNKICQTLSAPPTKPDETAVKPAENVPKEESISEKQKVSTELKPETCAVPSAQTEAIICDISCPKEPAIPVSKPVEPISIPPETPISKPQSIECPQPIQLVSDITSSLKVAEVPPQSAEQTKQIADSSSPISQVVLGNTETPKSDPVPDSASVPKTESIPESPKLEPIPLSSGTLKSEPASDSTSGTKSEAVPDSTVILKPEPASEIAVVPKTESVPEGPSVSQPEAVSESTVSTKSELVLDSPTVPKPEPVINSPTLEAVSDTGPVVKSESQCLIEKSVSGPGSPSTPPTEVLSQSDKKPDTVSTETPSQDPVTKPIVDTPSSPKPAEVPQSQDSDTKTTASKPDEVPISETVSQLPSPKPEEVPKSPSVSEIPKSTEVSKISESPEKPSGTSPKETEVVPEKSSASSPVSREQSIDDQAVPTPPPRKASGGGGGGSNKKGHKSKK